jgi:YD repeat-containing protein
MKSSSFRVSLVAGILALLIALIMPISYSALAGGHSSSGGSEPDEVGVQSQDRSSASEESHFGGLAPNSPREMRRLANDYASLQAKRVTAESTEAASEDPSIRYNYDELGRLVQVAYPDGTIITYTYDPAGNRVSTEVYLAWPDWDVNMDSNINILDVIQVGNHWGESGEPGWIREDVNDDGDINMLDVIMIGNHWGE